MNRHRCPPTVGRAHNARSPATKAVGTDGQIGHPLARGPAIGPSPTVNGQEAEPYGNYFVAEDVPLNAEGSNAITVVATDAVSRTGQADSSVTCDAYAPRSRPPGPAPFPPGWRLTTRDQGVHWTLFPRRVREALLTGDRGAFRASASINGVPHEGRDSVRTHRS